MNEIRNHFYRISIKALVLNKTRDKFLIIKEAQGDWDLPGGGFDWGTSPQEDLKREIKEEMGLDVNSVANNPSYFLTCTNKTGEIWIANVVYETVLESLDFTPSDECVEICFVDKSDLKQMDNIYENVKKLAEQFHSQ